MLRIFGRTLKPGDYVFVSSNKRGKVFVSPNSKDAEYAMLNPPLILSVSESSGTYELRFKWKGEEIGGVIEVASERLKEGLKLAENAATFKEKEILEEKGFYKKIKA